MQFNPERHLRESDFPDPSDNSDVPYPTRNDSASSKELPLRSFPFFSLFSTLLGLCVALVLVPEDLEPAASLKPSALALSIGILSGPALATARSFKSFFLAEHLISLSPIYWLLLDLIQGSFTLIGLSQSQARTAFLAIGLFNIFFWLATLRQFIPTPTWLSRSTHQRYSGRTLFAFTTVAFLVGVFKFAYPCRFNPVEIAYYLTQDRWSAPWVRGDFGGWEAFIEHMQYFGYALPALLVMLASKIGWTKWQSLSAFLMTLIMLAFMIHSGSRRIVGVMLGIAVIIWILNRRSITKGSVFAIVLTSASLLFLMELMVNTRTTGLEKLKAMSEAERAQLTAVSQIHVDDNFLRLTQIIKFIPDYFPYVGGRYITWVLIRPIPRVLWPGKPTDPGFNLPAVLGQEGVSLSCSVIGEFYLCGGMPAVALGGILFGMIAGISSGVLRNGSGDGGLFVYGSLVMSAFAGMRSLIDLLLMGYVVLAWVLITTIHRRFSDDSTSTPSEVPDEHLSY